MNPKILHLFVQTHDELTEDLMWKWKMLLADWNVELKVLEVKTEDDPIKNKRTKETIL